VALGNSNSSWVDQVFSTAAAEGTSDTQRTGENMVDKRGTTRPIGDLETL